MAASGAPGGMGGMGGMKGKMDSAQMKNMVQGHMQQKVMVID